MSPDPSPESKKISDRYYRPAAGCAVFIWVAIVSVIILASWFDSPPWLSQAVRNTVWIVSGAGFLMFILRIIFILKGKYYRSDEDFALARDMLPLLVGLACLAAGWWVTGAIILCVFIVGRLALRWARHKTAI